MVKQLVIVTRYFLPYRNVDSDSVYQMVANLLKIDPNLDIQIVTTDSAYKSDTPEDGKYAKNVLDKLKVTRIKAFKPISNSKGLILLSNLIDGYRLISKAKSTGILNVISLTNPPLISMWCSLLLKGRNFFYWTFDLYPEAFAADGILSKSSLIYKTFDKLAYKNAPAVLISLGTYQFEYLTEKFGSHSQQVILPCGVHDEKQKSKDYGPLWSDDTKIVLGYIGNIGRAHSLSFLKSVISNVKGRTSVKLLISVYGFHKEAIINYVKEVNADNIILVDFVDKSELNFIDIHLVSLKESWRNVSVPSKAVSAVCSGSLLWFCGSEKSDTWGMFESCSFRTSDDSKEINVILDSLNFEELNTKKANAHIIKSKLLLTEDKAYLDIYQNLIQQ